MHRSLLIAAALCPGLLSPASGQVIGRNAYLYSSGLWRTRMIPVCWETPGYDPEKAIVAEAITRTWEAESAIAFAGWGACVSNAVGIRIRIADENPRVLGLGSQLNGMPGGMVLNFTFQQWSSDYCPTRRAYCIRVIAVHEFGHALSFAHEQNRPDTPAWCRETQGGGGDIRIGAWDLESVMNYCNPTWTNNGVLSAGDTEGVRSHYGLPAWKAEGDAEKLLSAARRGDLDGVKRYLTPSTIFAQEPREGLNALMLAADKCYLDIAQYLLNSGMLALEDVNRRNRYQDNALRIALGTERELREKGIIQPRCAAMEPMLRQFGSR